VTYSFLPHHGTGVDSAPNENKYQEHFLGVKAAGAWGWQPHHLHVPNVIKSAILNLLKPSGPHRANYGTALPVLYIPGRSLEQPPVEWVMETNSPRVQNGLKTKMRNHLHLLRRLRIRVTIFTLLPIFRGTVQN